MNGFVLHVNNNLENQFISPAKHAVNLKKLVAASRNIAWFSKRDMQFLLFF